MPDKESPVQTILSAFERSDYPGDAYLLGSREGCEPLDEVLPFQGKANWKALTAEFLVDLRDELKCVRSAILR